MCMCGVLNENGSFRLIGSGTIKRCGLIGVGVAWLEEVCHEVVDLEVSEAQVTPSDSLPFLATGSGRYRTHNLPL